MAGWIAAVASALTVLTLFDSVSRLHTVEYREGIEDLLATPPYDGLGMELPQVIEMMRGAMFLSAAVAAAAVILAIYVLKRHNAARIGITVAAVLLVLTAPFGGGLLPLLVAVAATWLWTAPSRDWFAGRPVTQDAGGGRAGRSDQPGSVWAARQQRPRVEGSTVSSENHPPADRPEQPASGEQGPEGTSGQARPWMPEGSAERPTPPPSPGFGSPSGEQGQPGQQGGQPPGGYPPPYAQQPPPGPQYGQPPYGQGYGQPPHGQGYGQPPHGQGYAQPQPGQGGQGYGPQYARPVYGQPQYGQPVYGQPQGQQPYGAYGSRPDADRRPTTVTAAAWTTWVFAGLTLIGLLLSIAGLVGARDEILAELARNPDVAQFDYSADQLMSVIWVMMIILVIWTVSALVLAWLAFRRSGWARIALVVSSAMAALFTLFGALGSPLLLVVTLAAGATAVLLFVGGANEWYSRRGGSAGQAGPFQPYGQASSPQYGQQGQQGGPQYGEQQQGQPPYGQPSSGAQRPEGEDRRGSDDRRGKDEPPSNVW